jgi:transcriptional regulator with GAF, ATPase, and Fis domain
MIAPHRRVASHISRDLLVAVGLTTLAVVIEARFAPLATLRAALRAFSPEWSDKIADVGRILIVATVSFTWWRWYASSRARVGAVQRENAYLTALHETALGLLNRLDLAELLETILGQAGALLGTPDGIIVFAQDANTELTTRIGTGVFRDDPPPPMRRGEGLIGVAWETGEPLVLNDYQSWPKRRIGEERDRIHAAVAVPLHADGRVIGVISLVHLQPERAFSAAEVELLTRFAHLAAIALDNARNYTLLRV